MLKVFKSIIFINILPKKYNFLLFIVPIFIFIGTFLELLNIGILIPLISFIFGESNPNDFERLGFLLSFFSKFSDLNSLLLFFALIYFIKSIYIYLQNYFHYYLLASIRKDLTIDLYKNYLNLNYINFKNENSNVLLKNLTEIISQFTGTYLNALIFIIVEMSLMITILIFLILINFKVVLIISALSVFVSLAYNFLFKKRIKKWGEYRVNAQGEIFSIFKESFLNFIEIKIYNSENYFLEKIKKIYDNFKIQDTLYQTTLQIPKIIFEFLAIIFFIIFILIMKQSVINTENLFIQLGIFGFASMRILPSLSRLNSQLTNLIYAKPNLALLQKELNRKTSSKHLPKNYDFRSDLILKDFSFSYKNENIFSKANMIIKPNSITAIFGESGSGKSTLSKIVMGMLDINEGSIFLGDQKIDYNNKYWYQNFSIVTQDNSILDKSLFENISYQSIQENENDLVLFNNVIEQSGLKKFLKDLKDSHLTIIGDMGSLISGGQKQRIQIARALYHKSKILILDEATSSIDPSTEIMILKELSKLKNDLTILLITHKKENLKFADYIYKIENKNIRKFNDTL